MAVRWFSMSERFLSDGKIEALGEVFGPAGPLTILALIENVPVNSTSGQVWGTHAALAKLVHAEVAAVEEIVSLAAKIGILETTRSEDYDLSVKVNRPYYMPARRQAVPRQVREWILHRDQWICGLCGGSIAPDDEVHIDHIIPWSKGGPDTPDNLQAAHGFCNRSKRDRF